MFSPQHFGHWDEGEIEHCATENVVNNDWKSWNVTPTVEFAHDGDGILLIICYKYNHANEFKNIKYDQYGVTEFILWENQQI